MPTSERTHPKLGAPLILTNGRVVPTGKPRAYRLDLTPIISLLFPHCLATDRLWMWIPAWSPIPIDAFGDTLLSIVEDLRRGPKVKVEALALSTRSLYGSAILLFVVWAKLRDLEPKVFFPSTTHVIDAFALAMTGSYASTTISTYISAIHKWHTVHNLTWTVDDAIVQQTIKGAAAFVPEASKRAKRAPYTTDMLSRIKGQLNLENPLDAAVWAICCTAFWAVCRMGELTIKSGSFSPSVHPTPANVRLQTSRDGSQVRAPESSTPSVF
jgi:hypothetical protein